MSSLRKMAQLLAMLACVGLSTWAIGCGDPNKTNGTADGIPAGGATLDETTTDGAGAGSDEAGSGTSDGGAGGIDVPEPEGDAETPTETE